MLPSTKVHSFEEDNDALFSETAEEAGVSVVVHNMIGSRIHPVTGNDCTYYFCTTAETSPGARSLDNNENSDVAWGPFKRCLT